MLGFFTMILRIVRMTSIFLLVLMQTPLTEAGSLDDYYLQKLGRHTGGQDRIAGVSETSSGQEFEPCYTPVYHGLHSDWAKLLPGTQKTLAKVLAKPTLVDEAIFKSASGHFTIHYATSGSDAPPLVDGDANGIPDWVEMVAEVFEVVYSKEVGEMAYFAAPTSKSQPFDPYNIYLQNLGEGSVKYLGFTNYEIPIGPASYTSYITIDNDFAEFSHQKYSALDYLQITAAHEYHHAIQYGYNFYFDVWYAEATSTWIEDEVFDSVNQLYDYLPAWFQNMGLPLNTTVSLATGGGYGRWLFNRHIAETRGRDMVRTIWTRLAQKGATADGSNIPMMPILDELLGGIGGELLGFGKKLALRNWASHQDEISLIDPLLPLDGSSPLPLSSFPAQPYSMAFFTYPLNSESGVDLSAKPNIVLASTVSTSQFDILVLCNSGVAIATTSSGGGGGGCFIATAAYGSNIHPKVMVLRGFRDRWLMTNPFGRMLVNCYYTVSPHMAAVIVRHEWMRRGCRALLAPLVATVEHPESVASLVLGLLGWVLIRRWVNQQYGV